MENKKIIIKEGINLHLLKTDLFKTNYSAIFITTPLTKECVTKNALIPAVLRAGSKTMPSQEVINKELEELYGSIFNCGIDKNGDNQVLKFYIESVSNIFVPNNEPVLEQSIEKLFDIVFNPLTEANAFNKNYFETEKQNLSKVISAKKDDKDSYALFKLVNLMYNDKGFGLYKYGYLEDLEKLTSEDLYSYYLELIKTAKIDIFISGEFDESKIEELVKNNSIIQGLNSRKENYILNDVSTEIKQKVDNYKEEVEKLDVVQGKLLLGLDILSKPQDLKYIAMVYNTILGSGANSMLFQNVREKASLAYTARSAYIKPKCNIIIKCGIEINNYDKALQIIKDQLNDIKNGNFTNEQIENAKRYIYTNIDSIDTEQDTGIIYYLGQELAKTNISPAEYKEKIANVSREQIIDLANNIQINMIYFLRN